MSLKKFWKGIGRETHGKATKYATKVGDATEETDVRMMWKNHFSSLYNSVHADHVKLEVLSQLVIIVILMFWMFRLYLMQSKNRRRVNLLDLMVCLRNPLSVVVQFYGFI